MPRSTINGTAIDLDGKEMILDADQDTTLTVDTDDRVDIKVAGTDTVHIDASGIGVNINNPLYPLHVTEASGGDTAAIFIDGPTDGTSALYMGDSDDIDIGAIQYDHSSNYMFFRTNAAERMRIDSSGRLLLGTTTPSSYSNRMFTVAGNDDATIEIRANPSNGHSQLVFSDGTAADNTSQRGYIVYDHPDENFKFGVYDTEFMRAHSIGAVTFSKQPAFYAEVTGAQTLSANTLTTVAHDTERFDQNDDYNTSTYKFVAPVTGKYLLTLYLRLDRMDQASSYADIRIRTSNRNYQQVFDTDVQTSADLNFHSFGFSVVADMDANDEAYTSVYIEGSVSSSHGSTYVNTSGSTGFSGCLLA